MSRSQRAAERHHHESPDCPTGPRSMMSHVHRVGCATQRNCASRTPAGPARATHYAKVEQFEKGRRTTQRAMYLCDRCASAFAHRFGLDQPTSSAGSTP